ncbi:DUF952 domain-containing protein [Congregibacter sp.]|uniref:DUF952 domain-containing protein n=1 Tax=Congregibacter sp. TaxID=2744308 RepID=UPI00385A8A48
MQRLLIVLFALFTTHSLQAQEPLNPTGFPYVFHMVQARLWDQVLEDGSTYYPPTYKADGFTHGTSNPDKLMNVANHFYPDVKGEWYCLRMTVESLAATGVTTVFEGTAPVGDIPPDFEGATDELFPHILGGIKPAAVLEAHTIVRDPDGTFLSIQGVTD